jgi:hypothetical protein
VSAFASTSDEAMSGPLERSRTSERIRKIHASNYFAHGSWRMSKALLRAGGRGPFERLMRVHGAKRP